MKEVVILVGASGAGKSTWIQEHGWESSDYLYALTVSADHYFMKKGLYDFDATKLGEAHKACQENFLHCLKGEAVAIYVDNTNTRAWERQFYIDEAKKAGWKVFLKVFKVDPEVAAARNKHGVSIDAIKRMNDRIDVPEGHYEV